MGASTLKAAQQVTDPNKRIQAEALAKKIQEEAAKKQAQSSTSAVDSQKNDVASKASAKEEIGHANKLASAAKLGEKITAATRDKNEEWHRHLLAQELKAKQ